MVVLSRTWQDDRSEASFVLRSLAGALSTHVEIDVVTPGETRSSADGFFDVRGIGTAGGVADRWPQPHDVESSVVAPVGDESVLAAVVDGADPAALSILELHAPHLPRLVVSAGTPSLRPGDSLLDPLHLGIPVPVNPLAATRPHNGFGFTDYVLVLTDRAPNQRARTEDPTPEAAWLIARFPSEHVVVVENATASAWRDRSLRGSIHVDTRTDLWRLMAHARVTVDLCPGPLLARECVESLLYGTPVVAPKGTVGAAHANAGGGLSFGDVAELLDCVEALAQPSLRARMSSEGERSTARRHGDPASFASHLAATLRIATLASKHS